MSQQFQPTTESQPQQSSEMSQQGGGMGQHGGGMGQQGGQQTMSKTLPQSEWTVLTNIAQSIAVCEFCADQCIREADPMMTECIRTCEDVADIGKSLLSLIPHGSRNAQPMLSTFETALQACAQECSQHQHAHCQECAQVLGQTLEATSQFAGGMQGGTQGMQGGMSQGM